MGADRDELLQPPELQQSVNKYYVDADSGDNQRRRRSKLKFNGRSTRRPGIPDGPAHRHAGLATTGSVPMSNTGPTNIVLNPVGRSGGFKHATRRLTTDRSQ